MPSPHTTGEFRRLRFFELKLTRIASEVSGSASYHAERVTDLVEQIDELRQELKAVAERQEKMANWLRERAKHFNGETDETTET